MAEGKARRGGPGRLFGPARPAAGETGQLETGPCGQSIDVALAVGPVQATARASLFSVWITAGFAYTFFISGASPSIVVESSGLYTDPARIRKG